MHPTRREFLRLGLGTSTLLACGATVPAFLARSASALAAAPPEAAKGRALVVVQLDGGNDGLNTVVPYRDDAYRKHRPTLGLPENQLHKIDDRVALHPALGGLARLLEKGRLAVVQGVGYPNPNRSHFESMAVWHTADLKPDAQAPGWLARYLDRRAGEAGGDAPALHVSQELLPQALAGGQRQVPSLVSLEQFRRRLGVPEAAGAAGQRAALDKVAELPRGGDGSLLQFVQRATLVTYASSARLEEALRGRGESAGYPEYSSLGRQLRLVGHLVKAGLTTSLYYTHLDGFDTHSNQLPAHAGLLGQLGESLQAFFDDLARAGEADRVLVLVFSEFGRRLAENGSLGTDHGTAAPVLLAGPGVKAGLHGRHPDLNDLDDGDPKFGIDFRRVYATLLDGWLGCPSAGVLGEKLEPLAVLSGK